MKRILAFTALLALVAFVAVAGAQTLVSGTLSGYKISATQTNTTTTFPTTSGAATSISVYNSSATNEIFVAINAVATASSVEIPAGATLTLTNFAATSIGVICSTGETATVYIYETAR
jgi:hypothetical protein